jgi:hypothetical protein
MEGFGRARTAETGIKKTPSDPSGRVVWIGNKNIELQRMKLSCERRASLPDACPGQINWDYDRAEIIADGAVHAIGVWTHRRRHNRRDRSQGGRDPNHADLGLRDRPGDDAGALGRVQHVAGLARQVDSASVRPLRDLFIDRRNLHAVPRADEKRSGFGRSRRRRMVERCHRHGSEAHTSRAVRPPGRRPLPAAGLERCHCLRLACVCPPEPEHMASRNRRPSLFSWHALSCLAGPALSQCDLARFRADRRKLPLFGDPRLLVLGISG